MAATLHYIYDPLCGWCYGAEPLVLAAARVAGLEIALHAGALWPQPTRLPEDMRRYIQQADQRIAQMSGQPFGVPYLKGSLLDPTLVLDSRPVIKAVVAAESLDASTALPMLRGIQHAHYEHGRRVVEEDTLLDIGASIGLDRAAFATAMRVVPVERHIAESREFMKQLGAQGFPTFALQQGDDWSAVPHGRFASAPAQFAAWLAAQLRSQPAAH